MKELIYDEFIQTGVDYEKGENVDTYYENMSFRNYEREAKEIIEEIGMKNIDTLLDLGCGDGGLTSIYSKYAKKVIAADVSELMLSKAKENCMKMKCNNVEFLNKGFLTYSLPDKSVDVIISDIALHHLPDFWKQVAIYRMFKTIKEGGVLYLADQVYSFNVNEYEKELTNWVEFNYMRSRNEKHRQDVITSIKEEYSTFDWILENMLKNVGFHVTKRSDTKCFMTYICKK